MKKNASDRVSHPSEILAVIATRVLRSDRPIIAYFNPKVKLVMIILIIMKFKVIIMII